MKKNFLIFSLLVFLAIGCTNGINTTGQGALLGTALGAGTGAIIGSRTGDAGRGTAIGAGLGAIAGTIAGATVQNQQEQNQALHGQVANNQRLIEENQRLIDELRRRGADVRSSPRGVVVNLPDILFEFDRYELTPEARRTVGEISAVLRTVPNRMISVEGHTDSIGTVTYNKRLSENRAFNTAHELERNGINRARLRSRGFGEGAPISTNNSEYGRARNRRVEVIVEN